MSSHRIWMLLLDCSSNAAMLHPRADCQVADQRGRQWTGARDIKRYHQDTVIDVLLTSMYRC